MSKKKRKKSDKDQRLATIVLITAVFELVRVIFEILKALLE